MRITNDVEYGGFQLTGGARHGERHPNPHVWVMIAVGAMFSTITHPRGGLRKEKTLYPRMRANAAPDGAKRYLSASGEGDVEGQAPGVIYNK